MKARQKENEEGREEAEFKSLWLRQELVSGAVVKMTKTTRRRQQKRPKGCNGSGKSRLAAMPPLFVVFFVILLYFVTFFLSQAREPETPCHPLALTHTGMQTHRCISQILAPTQAHGGNGCCNHQRKKQQQHVHSFISSPRCALFRALRRSAAANRAPRTKMCKFDHDINFKMFFDSH